MPRTGGNENTMYQDTWETMKARLWGKYIVINAYIKQTKERSQITD